MSIFNVEIYGECSGLALAEWTERGIRHGCCGRNLASSSAETSAFCSLYEKILSIEQLIVLHQVHGSRCLDMRDSEKLSRLREASKRGKPYPKQLQADSVIVRSSGYNIGVGIITADCLPIIIKSGDEFALIHAGWRGLAAGVVEDAFNILTRRRKGTLIEVLFGPAVGIRQYPVGRDVVEEIGKRAVFEKNDNGEIYLSLVLTAKKILERLNSKGKNIFFNTQICTISNGGYHSYRRDGEKCGRNLTFIMI